MATLLIRLADCDPRDDAGVDRELTEECGDLPAAAKIPSLLVPAAAILSCEAECELIKGTNQILLRIDQATGEWMFAVEIDARDRWPADVLWEPIE